MQTPICDFIDSYVSQNALRLHMPGHKGKNILGAEGMDITEISGADSLYEAEGIIKESEDNASLLFSCPTFYSTEGSSQCIRAMLYLACLDAKSKNKKPRIASFRNVHKTFLSAAALLDFDITWLYPDNNNSLLSCNITESELIFFLDSLQSLPTALYVTSPDYLGNMLDIKAFARICKERDILLLVDNAHGAYLKFLPASMHPMDLGADISCSSAHKTLPVLTGGAYLHLSESFYEKHKNCVKNALSLFGSTSPSYLILASLDKVNLYLEKYPSLLSSFTEKVNSIKKELAAHGYSLYGNEPLKITIEAKKYGYTGNALSSILENENIFPEFSDNDFLVLMLTPENTSLSLDKLLSVLLSVPKKSEIKVLPPKYSKPHKVMSVREASLSLCEYVPAVHSLGRILASPSVSCPPAVPIAVCGEKIDECVIENFIYYGRDTVCVIK